MTGRLPGYFALDRYSITADDVVRLAMHCGPSAILPSVLMTPVWSLDDFLDAADLVGTVTPDTVFTLEYEGSRVTLIRSGIGAPQTSDMMLALACTPCTRVVFVGSAGGLVPGMRIGDLLLPTASVAGDGFSRYLSDGSVAWAGPPGAATPDPAVLENLRSLCRLHSEGIDTTVHEGRVFSTDSIVAQFHHLGEMTHDLGCTGIEMETAAVFRAAALTGISAGALLQISDVIPDRKSLFSGRDETDRQRRRSLRRGVLARAALGALVPACPAG
ncbi:MAG: hypothetical protein QUS11_07300 [Candidatus Fermentibacter sp.]|nr:hypothetical protein [Candidatus Fermentibacter sp.]